MMFSAAVLTGLTGSILSSTPAHAQTANREATVALFEALKRNDAREVRSLLLRGVDPNSGTVATAPAIVYAAAHKSFTALQALLDSPQLDLNKTNGRGENALMLASLYGEVAAVKALLTRGAEVNKPGWTPLHYAATGGFLEVAQLLIEQHAYVDAMSPNKTTPLMMAARQKSTTVARYLVEEGADPTQRNEHGWSVADYFQRHGETDQAEWFRQRAKEFEAKYGTIQAPKTIVPEAPK